jgi:N-methylhydantoinase B/oxoprolinase/acetone carboxylase alpha subunit
LRVRGAEITASQCTDRHKVKTWALFGGAEGRNGATLFQQSGRKDWRTTVEAYGKRSSSKYSNLTLRPGDRVRLEVSGGGGYGDPKSRERSLVEEDIREGFVSTDAARRLYGYATGGDD